MTTPSEPLSVEQLRRRWTLHKERPRGFRSDHPTPLRVHRALSWLGAAEQMDDENRAMKLNDPGRIP